MLAYTHITRIIAEQLYKHDCVIVPGFGGYVARSHSAMFSRSQTLLHPPAKTILFNKNLVHNDGLLASAVMENQGLTFEAANKLLDDYVNYCRAMLQAKNRLELKNLGLFYLDAEQVLRFEPEADVNFLISSFGLAPLAVHEPVEEIVPELRTVFEDKRPVTEVTPVIITRKRNYARIASLAVGIPAALGILLFAATSKPMKPLLESSLNPFYSPEKTYTPVNYIRSSLNLQTAEQDPLLADANGYASFSLGSRVFMANVSDTLSKPDKTSVKPVKAVHLASTPSSFDGQYQVVMGCFGVERNAERLVRELQNKNISAGISGVNARGLHVVSCGGFQTREDANALLNTIRANYPNAWVMAK